MRPTVFLEGFFLRLADAGVRDRDELVLPLGSSRTSPISAVDVARAVSVILDDPAPHVGHVYNLTGSESADLEHYARAFSDALGRTIHYRDVPLSAWTNTLREAGVPAHLVDHLAVMACSMTSQAMNSSPDCKTLRSNSRSWSSPPTGGQQASSLNCSAPIPGAWR
jgi:uncharacterized protein YbjT (DUF2867 family)